MATSKYDKSKVMKRAWYIFNHSFMSFSDALRESWKRIKEEVKKPAVHDGILEAICLLRETRNKVNSLILDEEVTCVIDAEGQLIRMSNSLCNFTTELSGIVGVIFSDRADEAIGEALKLNM